MKCPHCGQKAIPFFKIFMLFEAQCQSCESSIALKNDMSLKAYILYGLFLGSLLMYSVKDELFRSLVFFAAGCIVSLAHIRWGKLQIVRELEY